MVAESTEMTGDKELENGCWELETWNWKLESADFPVSNFQFFYSARPNPIHQFLDLRSFPVGQNADPIDTAGQPGDDHDTDHG